MLAFRMARFLFGIGAITLGTRILTWAAVIDGRPGVLVAVLATSLPGISLPFILRSFRVPVAVFPISRRCLDLKLIKLVPFRIGTIPIRNGKEFANSTTQIV